ncbi:MAG: hypothetical protein IPF98_08220 [Gemmatimonadetes bacterium]|nr:hypothetical protein [Gemmatimonadota bacterium]
MNTRQLGWRRVGKAVRDAINLGVLAGPRVLTSLGSLNENTGSPDSIRAAVRRFKANGADVIKIFASKSIRDGGVQSMTQEQLRTRLCGRVQGRGCVATVHAHAASAAKSAVRWAPRWTTVSRWMTKRCR